MEVERTTSESLYIATDACHACRKNNYHTDMVALGYRTPRVVYHEHVTKRDEPSSQKHEATGVRRMYAHFKNEEIKVRLCESSLILLINSLSYKYCRWTAIKWCIALFSNDTSKHQQKRSQHISTSLCLGFISTKYFCKGTNKCTLNCM